MQSTEILFGTLDPYFEEYVGSGHGDYYGQSFRTGSGSTSFDSYGHCYRDVDGVHINGSGFGYGRTTLVAQKQYTHGYMRPPWWQLER